MNKFREKITALLSEDFNDRANSNAISKTEYMQSTEKEYNERLNLEDNENTLDGDILNPELYRSKKPRVKKKSSYTAYDYPLVIKMHEGYLTFSIPDFHYFKVINMPHGPLSPKFLIQVAKTVAQCWLASKNRLQTLDEHSIKPPSPTMIKDVLKQQKYKEIGVREASDMLGVSQQTVRRMADNGKLKCQKSSKGTRKFKLKDLIDP